MPQPPDALAASRLRVGYGGRDVVRGVDLAIPPAAFTALVGPNGSGKSTLLRALAGLTRPSGGGVTLGGRPLASFPRKELARRIGFLPQSPLAPEGLTVEELVQQGRYPHQGLFSRWNDADDNACEEALALASLGALRKRPLHELSGGQRQRAWIAMALAQQAGVMLLDEPTTFLDIAHQLDVLDLLRNLAHRAGATIVAVLHDLNLAARYSDNIVMILDGTIQTFGPPGEAMRPEMVDKVFGVRSRIIADPVDKTPLIVPLRALT